MPLNKDAVAPAIWKEGSGRMRKVWRSLSAKKMFAENKLNSTNGLYFQTQLPIINLWHGGEEFKLKRPWTALTFNNGGIRARLN